MPGFSLRRTLSIVSFRMLAPALVYPILNAVRVARSTQPKRRGLGYLRAVAASLRRGGRAGPAALESFASMGTVRSVACEDERTVRVRMERGSVRVRALAGDLRQIRYRPDDQFETPFSYSVEKPEDAWLPEQLTVEESQALVEIRSSGLRLVFEKASGHLSVSDAEGRLLFTQGQAFIGDDRASPVAWNASFMKETPFCGLGEKASGLNLAGKRFELWNTDPSGYGPGQDPIYMSIPFVIALTEGQALGLFFDNSHRAWVDLGSRVRGQFRYAATGGELRFYVMAGTPAQVLDRFTELVGRTKLPPLWAFGLHQSRWSYYPQERLLEVAREFRRRRIPCDVIHMDIHYLDGYRSFTWDRRRFPALDQMTSELHEQGFKALAMIDPGIRVDPGYHAHDEGVEKGYFLKYPDGTLFKGPVWPGNCYFPDFSNPEVRAWWGDLYRELMDQGIDAFWNDMNEPALISIRPGANQVPGVLVHDAEGRGATHAEIHNLYGLLMARTSVEGLGRLGPERRPLVLTRSGWAGVQRYAIHWTGDNQSTWDHLALTVPMVMNLGLSGVPITGPDTGGFTGGPSPELYARWMQLGAFTPFFRVHSMAGSPAQEPWAFGDEVERISRQYVELRYRLLPYLYTAAWQASRTGMPIVRSLFLAYPDERATHDLDDQFLFGDAFLVAPVLKEGTTRRRVYLPAGTWFDFWTGERHEGPAVVDVEAPLERLPLFVRGGSVVPFWPVQQYVGERALDELELRVYWTPGEHQSLLYEDDGVRPEGDAAVKGRLSRFTLKVGEEGSDRIARRTLSGNYRLPYRTTKIVILGRTERPKVTRVRGGEVVEEAWDRKAQVFTLRCKVRPEFVVEMG